MKYSIQTQDVKLLPSILESNLHTDLYVIYASDFTEIKHKRPNDGPDNSFSITYTFFLDDVSHLMYLNICQRRPCFCGAPVQELTYTWRLKGITKT